MLVHGVGASLDDSPTEGTESLADGRVDWSRIRVSVCGESLQPEQTLNRARGNGYKGVRRYLKGFPLVKLTFLSVGTVSAILLIDLSATTSCLL